MFKFLLQYSEFVVLKNELVADYENIILSFLHFEVVD